MNFKTRTISLVLTFISILSTLSSAQEGFRIEVDLDTFSGKEIYLAYYLGSNQYLRDTAHKEDGKFLFQGDTMLDPGVYMVVIPPDNRFFQLMISDDDQTLTAKADVANLNGSLVTEGSADNKIFYDYLSFLSDQRPYRDSLSSLYEAAEDATLKMEYQRQLESINGQVADRQKDIVENHPESISALMINTSLEVEIPEFDGPDEDKELKKYLYYKQHYFDHIDFDHPALLRTPTFHGKVDYFVNKLTVQTPDSINASIDFILSKFDPGSEAFRYYLIHFLNSYAGSKIIGMDAVYVHIVENYYAKGLASWTDEEQLNKIIKNASTLKPILIGKQAPDLQMRTREGESINLHDVEAEYTVLFFWDPECGHCKKAIPKMIEFYQNFKDRGIRIFSVCTGNKDEEEDCWNAVEEKGMGDFINVVDPYMLSRYKIIYDVKSTPQIYVLDKEKIIVMKRLGAEQLTEVMDNLIQHAQSQSSKS